MNLSWQHLIAFLVAMSVLVAVHEFGHFWVARRLGFKVLRFSIGFGKPLWQRSGAAPDHTEYVIAAFPLGGYVKMLDEREGPVDPAELHRAFTRRPHWQRILVLLAGPGFNAIFAIVLLTGLFLVNGVTEVKAVVGDVQVDSVAARAGLRSGDTILSLNDKPVKGQRDVLVGVLDGMSTSGRIALQVGDAQGQSRSVVMLVADPAQRRHLTEPELQLRGLGFSFWQPRLPAILGLVEAGGPAALAGLKPGDEILSLNGTAVQDWQSLRQRIELHGGESIVLGYRRKGVEANARVQVAVADGPDHPVGRIRVGPQTSVRYPDSMLIHQSLGPMGALWRGTVEAWDMTSMQARFLWRMVLGEVSIKNISGPLGIAEAAGDYAQQGVGAFAGFLVLVSLGLAFMNLLPIPILDGGQIVYQLVEWVRGTPLSERFQELSQRLGIALLVLLMGVALFNDIARQFG